MNKNLLFVNIFIISLMSFAFADAIVPDYYEDDEFESAYEDIYDDESTYEDEELESAYEVVDETDLSYQIIIEDGADLLTDEEEEKLRNDMIPLTEYGNIVFLSTNYNSQSQHDYAHDYYYPRFGEQSGSLLLVDMQNRYITLYCDGKNLEKIPPSKSDIIVDNVYRYASNEDWYGCASNAYEQIYKLLGGNVKKNSNNSNSFSLSTLLGILSGDTSEIPMTMKYVSNALIALVLAFLGTFIYILRHSKTVLPEADEILRNCNIKFQVLNTKAELAGERKVYSPVSESSGYSGHGSGGHSAGHSAGHSSHSAGHSSHSSGGSGSHRF